MSKIAELLTLTSMVGGYEPPVHRDHKPVTKAIRIKPSKDGRKVEYYTDSNGNMRRRKSNGR